MVKKHTPVMELISSILLMAGITGLLSNCSSLFYSPIASEFSYSNTTMSIIAIVKTLAVAISSFIAPALYEKITFEKGVFLGILLAGISFIAQGFISNIYLFCAVNFIFGFGLGLSYILPTSIMIKNWYKEKMGVYLGIAMAASGVASAIASSVFSSLVLNLGWRITIMIYGLVSLAIEIPNCLFLVKQEPTGEEAAYGENKSVEFKKAVSIGTVLTYLLTLYLVLVTSFTSNTMLQLSLYVKQCGLPLMYASVLSTVSMLANTVSKIVVGILDSKIGTFNTIAGAYLIAGIAYVLFITENISVVIVCSFFAGWSMSMSAMLSSMVARELYAADYNKVVSEWSAIGTVFSALASFMIGFSADLFSSYTPIFVFTGVLCLIGIIPVYILKEKAKVKNG